MQSAEPDAVVPWTKRQLRGANVGTRMRSEFALQRWDLVGDDSPSRTLLAQFALTTLSTSSGAVC